ncbi:MAG TPA: CHRD domain-containing protein [Gemmatimonadaceae bacterium]|nr:CHRD domain-containing protein [Gemmatimonadaceae bacterium]
MQKHVLKLAMAISLGVAIACGSDKATGPQNITYIANLKASNEVLQNGSSAGVNSPATGTWTGTLNPTTNVLTWTMTFSGLTANSSASHIHAQAPTTTTASVVLNFATFAGSTITLGGTSGTASGSINLATQAATPQSLTISGDSLLKAMNAGQAYVNVHSTGQYAAGEIRGQIVKQ